MAAASSRLARRTLAGLVGPEFDAAALGAAGQPPVRLGWPTHGHLVWASPKWWEAQFEKHGLVRDRSIERVIHDLLNEPFFKKEGVGRKSLFVLKHSGCEPDVQSISERLSASITSVLQQSQ
jgi:hypothetical protein